MKNIKFKARIIYDSMFPGNYTHNSGLKINSSVPSYFYHQVKKNQFNEICIKLNKADIRTITFKDIITNNLNEKKSILITFDDGWSSVWSIAFPLAKKYGLKFTLFIVPQAILDTDECRTTLEDGVNPEVLEFRDKSSHGMLTWGEVREMYNSGLVDVQSHSLHHGLIFSSPEIIDFCSHSGPFPLDSKIPLILRENGIDIAYNNPPYGTILHEWGPALASNRRFIENGEVRKRCVKLIQKRDGVFFLNDDWQSKLSDEIKQMERGRWETAEERKRRFKTDLMGAKKIIEERIDGLKVQIFAPPWGAMHKDLPHIAQQTGHELIVIGYRYDNPLPLSPIPVYPRLYGDSIWMYIAGPILGFIKWLIYRKQNLRRKQKGFIP